MKHYFLALLILIMAIPAHAATQVGAAAPGFSLQGSDGKEHSLDDFKGKIVVLEWYNHECPFVVKHYEGNWMQSRQKKYSDLGVVWLPVVSSAPGKQGHVTAEEAAEVAKENNLSVPAILLDPTGETGKTYGATNTPQMFVIDGEGILRYTGAAQKQNSKKREDDYISAALDALIDGVEIAQKVTKPWGCSVKY